MYTVYILFSPGTGRYYTGYTSGNAGDRLSRHLCDHGDYTASTRDWKIVWTREFNNKKDALLEERRIKKRGAGRFLSSGG